MKRYYVAFYRGRGTLADRIVRFATRSDFSHCELILCERRPAYDRPARCIGSSGRDNGVRIKDIVLKREKWRIYDVPWAPADTWLRAEAELGKPYDLWSMFYSQLFNFRRHARDKWFCSEIVAHALGLDMPHAYSPGDLLRAIRDHTDTWDLARRRFAGEEDGEDEVEAYG